MLRRYLDFSDARDSIPTDLLWHYTNIGGVKGILDSGSLWSTDAQFLNDDAELIAGMPIVTDYLTSGAASLADDDDRQRLIASIIKMMKDVTRSGGWSQNFMCSLSAVSDSLSQYRAYGNYALGFDKALLAQASPDLPDGTPGPGSPDILAPVVYVDPVRPSIRSTELQEYLTTTLQGYVTDQDRVQPSLQWHTRHDSILKVLSLLKHEAFRSEEEWRMRWVPFYAVGDQEPLQGDYSPKVHYREARGGLIVHVPMHFPPGALKCILVGPSDHQEEHFQGLRSYVAATVPRYEGRAVGVVPSAIPYRPTTSG